MDKIYTDKEIISKIKNGSESMFRYLYDQFYYKLNTFSYHIVMCDESHDIVHDIFAKLWLNRKDLPIDTNIQSYLYSAVRNSSLNLLKKNKILDDNQQKIVEAILFVQDSYNEDTIYNNELYDRLNFFIDQLPEQQRNIIKLRFDGDSYEDISQKMGISVKTINNHIYKAYNFLRSKMLIINILYSIFK